MKYFSYIVIMVLIISVTALFYLKKPDGDTWLTPAGIKQHVVEQKNNVNGLFDDAIETAAGVTESTKKQWQSLTGNSTTEQPTQIYQWQDATGQWHFSDSPNKQGESEQVALDPKEITVIAAEDTSILSENHKAVKKTQSDKTTPNTYSPDSVKQLFSDTEKVKALLEQRNKELENF
ncbi:DUF4124 domain-containing protein [Pseudoalteromonas sp. MMG010]|uniref:DUF4124 domain-containing protein n=1 Tax=Pseudoalteromonas sp. MMG010 TaxID=2822685 RepID=UPI001B3A770C|nr:DUF4124 domain-containing protein [Pseudoalteromonas sp. MMG010]MBQ4834407.1 DUF4124 domain-containing protein [Pseudoalteromonas sp. MMG010]